MDFKTVTAALLQRFQERHVRYGLMGGFALGLWGVARSTVDLDFLVHRDDLARIDEIMRDLAYECKFRSENVAQYASSLNRYGEVDFLFAFREASRGMLKRSVEKKIFGGELAIKVLLPEDLIGLKLQAVKNNPSRREQDMADIKALCTVQRELDWQLIRQYGEILDAQDLLKEVAEP